MIATGRVRYTIHMLQILLHSSKTMRHEPAEYAPLDTPRFLPEAIKLADTWKAAPTKIIATRMKLSPAKITETQQLFGNWSATPQHPIPTIDAFKGDIYSGLQVPSWTEADRRYAHAHLLILSGLYGALRACDGIAPYRLEMGYKLPDGTSMYKFWGDTLAQALPANTSVIINLSAVEYTKALLPHVSARVITPKFLTISPKTGEPTFVTVHAKIARGAFARWLIVRKIEDTSQLPTFAELGYRYNAALSSPEQPVFVCETFAGLGLSVR